MRLFNEKSSQSDKHFDFIESYPVNSKGNPVKALMVRNRNIALRSRLKDVFLYLFWSDALIALLTIIGTQAPNWPSLVFPAVFLIYAIPATVGSMYNIVVNRLHRQYKLNENGKLSHYNRKWFMWLIGFSIFYLISGFLFVLQAPSWDSAEWILIWFAIPGYYIVYQVVQYICKKEYASKFYKASAIKWSIAITTIFLCLIYAIVFASPTSDVHINISEMIQGRSMPFENSRCALLAEADKISTYTNCLTRYGLNQIQGLSYVVALLVKLLLSIPVFFGIVSQLACCLLSFQEVKSEFQLLPSNDQEDKDSPIFLRYIAIVIGIWIVFVAIFTWAEYKIEEIRATNAYTEIDKRLDDLANWIALASDHSAEEVINVVALIDDSKKFNDEFKQRAKNVIKDHEGKLNERINAYYDACVSNLNSYIDWSESIPGRLAKFAKFLGEDMAIDEFNKRVIDPASRSDLDGEYEAYITELKTLYDEYRASEDAHIVDSAVHMPTSDEIASNISIPPVLWMSWDGDERSKIARDILLNTEEGVDKDGLRAKIVEYFINKERDRTLSNVDGLASKFFTDL